MWLLWELGAEKVLYPFCLLLREVRGGGFFVCLLAFLFLFSKKKKKKTTENLENF